MQIALSWKVPFDNESQREPKRHKVATAESEDSLVNTAGEPEALGEMCAQTGAIATATHDTDGQLHWTVQSSDGFSTDTKALASTASWTPVPKGAAP